LKAIFDTNVLIAAFLHGGNLCQAPDPGTHMNRKPIYEFILILGILASLLGHAKEAFSEGAGMERTAIRFAIYLTDKNVAAGGYSYEALADLDQFTLGLEPFITENDIKLYDWEKQDLVLTEVASERMIKKYGVRPIMEITKIFVVAVDGKRIYAGAMTYPETAMYLDFPIIVPANENGRFIVRIRPSILYAFSSYPGDKKQKERHAKGIALIEDPRIRKVFKEIGKLAEAS